MPLGLPGLRSRPADLLQRALDGTTLSGERVPAALGGYVEVATRLADLVPTTSLRPDPAYRAELHTRLLELAAARAAELPERSVRVGTVERSRAGVDREPAAGRRGILRGWRRTVAAATAAVVALLLGVGVASAGAVPGGLLYPVKELIQSVQVHLAHGSLARSKVLLGQARGHITDATTLVSQGAPDPSNVNTALRQAGDDFGRGEQLALARYTDAHDPAGLAALSQFTVTQSPLVSRLRDRVPVVSVPLVRQLLAQIGQGAATLQQVVTQCGAPCASVSLVNLPGPDGLPAATPGGLGDATSGSSGISGISGTTSGLGGAAVGGSGASSGAGLGGLLGGGGSGSGASSGSSGVASIGSDGVGVQLPGVGASVPAPHASVGSGGASVGLPGGKATVGHISATLPGVGVTLGAQPSTSTHPPENSASSPPTVCLLIVCLGG